MTRKLAGVLVLALVASGCASSRAFRHGQDAVRASDWDSAVTYFTKALQGNPDSTEYKVNLQRAQEEAARQHTERARQLERQDQLDAALAEYRKSLELIGTDRLVQSKVAELERTIRERLEANRPKPRIEQLRSEAQRGSAPPLLNPASREPLRINVGAQSGLRDILNFIGTASGININYDSAFQDKPYGPVNLDGVTLEEALNQVLSANQYYYKITGAKTIIIIPDQPAKHQQYDDLVMRVFYINHADSTELAALVNSVMRIPQMAVQPMVMPNKTANTITVRATAPVMDIVDRLIRANDRPRAEVVLDVQILEVNTQRIKHYGINLSQYALNLLFSPELAPPNTTAVSAPPPFNLNTVSQGVSTNDFYLGVPYAVVNFLEQDSTTRTLAKPQLRGAEGQKLTLNLGQQIPVISTVFGAAAAGGLATTPQSSYNYKDVGVNLEITPTVTYDGDVRLDISVENSSLGPSIDVGGQATPSFNSRKVHTFLRLREGEANLLAGLIRQDKSRSNSGVPGLSHVPGIRSLFTNNDINDSDTDIVMLVTPHVLRDHELTKEDVSNIYIGTQSNVGLSGPPQLIAPQTEAPPAAAAPAPAAGATTPPNMSPGGVPGPPFGSPGGVNPTIPPTPPGTVPVPGYVTTPTQPPTVPPTLTNQPTPTAPNPAANPPAAPPAAATPPAGAAPPVAQPPAAEAPPREARPTGGAPGAGTPAATPAQIILTPPGTEFRVGGGPYTVPISINNATGISTLTLTIVYNPSVVRVRSVTEGTFMRQGGVTASFTPKNDAANGRIDLAFTRANDQTGASGAGLIGALVIDALSAGSSTIAITAVALGPTGQPISLTSSPVTVTVR
jgi:general secretion pathway protein D